MNQDLERFLQAGRFKQQAQKITFSDTRAKVKISSSAAAKVEEKIDAGILSTVGLEEVKMARQG